MNAGNVYQTRIGEQGNFALRSNYGFGFRWFSPIGVLRFEFGFPVNPKTNRLGRKGDNEAGNQFNFDIGQLF